LADDRCLVRVNVRVYLFIYGVKYSLEVNKCVELAYKVLESD